MPTIQGQRALDMTGVQSLAQENLPAPLGDVVDGQTAQHRSGRRHQGVVRHALLVLDDHQHDQNVVDLRQRHKRRVKKRDDKKPWPTQRKSDAM